MVSITLQSLQRLIHLEGKNGSGLVLMMSINLQLFGIQWRCFLVDSNRFPGQKLSNSSVKIIAEAHDKKDIINFDPTPCKFNIFYLLDIFPHVRACIACLSFSNIGRFNYSDPFKRRINLPTHTHLLMDYSNQVCCTS